MPEPSEGTPSREDAAFDLAFPTIPHLSSALLTIAGEEALRALVKWHHERLRRSSIRDRFPADPKVFDAVVKRISNFVVQTAQGSPPFAPSRERTWLRVRHLPITIDEQARNVWLAELLAAFDDVGFPNEARRELWNWVEALSVVIINRRTMIGQPRRYPLADAAAVLRPFMSAGPGPSAPRG